MHSAGHGPGTDAPLPSALEHVQGMRPGLWARDVVVFLDYDGTLTPIVARPEEATLSEDMRRTVRALARHAPVGVISGRDLKDLRQRVELEELYYAGSHGFDIEGPPPQRITRQEAVDHLPHLDRAERRLRERLGTADGIRIERKKFCITVHYRGAGRGEVRGAETVVNETINEIDLLRLHSGKKIWELRPDVQWDKGCAVRYLLDKILGVNREKSLVIYIGDDATDEDAFRRLHPRDMGIVVNAAGNRRSAARYRLESPDEVKVFLQALLAGLRRGFQTGS